MTKRKSNKGWFFLILVLLLAGGGYFWWKKRTPASEVAEYKTAVVQKGDVIQLVTANGQLSPVVSVDVSSQVSGNIRKLYVDFNSKVTNGQLIAELDPASYEARMVQAESEVANAKAQHSLAKVNARRAEELFKEKLIAQADYEQTMAQLEQTAAMMKMREASQKSADVDLARTKIYSPVDGMVISRNMNVGQTVQASFSAPTMFHIANDLANMEIAAMVSEADIGGVEENQEVTFTVEAFPTRTFRGRVAQVRNQPTTNQNVVTYATIIEVKNADLKLKPGMTANVSITTAKKEKVLRVPNSALRFRPPEGAPAKTNTVLLASVGTNQPAADRSTGGGSGDGLDFAGSPEMRQRILQRYDKNGDGKLDEAERQAMQEARASRGSGGGSGGGGGGFGGGSGRMRGEAQTVRTVYLTQTNGASLGGKPLELQPVQVRTGITDGLLTEIVEGLKEGDVIVTGLVSTNTATASQQNNPFGSPFGGRGRPR